MIDHVQEGYTCVLLGVTTAVSYFLGWLFLSWSKLRLFGMKDPHDGAFAIVGIAVMLEAIWLSWTMPTVTSVAFALLFAVYSVRNGQRSA